MPELPEAEFNRRRVEAQCLHRIIEAAEPGANVTFIELPGDNERARLVGRQFSRARRHGKVIFAGSAAGPWIAVHLGMTGRLVPFDEGEDTGDPKFVIRFAGERRLAFLDKRKLGWLRVIDDPAAFIAAQGYGPDALEVGEEAFARIIGRTGGAVKAALMDQRKLAGIGNLWSDEILFQVGVAPARPADELPAARLGAMFEAMRQVLDAVLQTEMDYTTLPADWLIRSRTKGARCPRCKGTIATCKVGGRTAYFCTEHQR